MTDLTERLDAIQATLDAATPGPWRVRECPPCAARGRLEVNIWDKSGNLMVTGWCDDDEFHRPDAEFIAAAPSDVAFLLDLARKQGAALARVEIACDAMDAGTAIRSGDPRTKSFPAQAIRAVIQEEMEAKP